MISLGKLSAGLAHELNNPASAIERCAAMLEDRLKDSEEATRDLATATLSDSQMAAVDAVRTSCMAKQSYCVRSPLEQCDREEEIAEWLARHGLDTASAHMLADTEVTFEALDALVAAVERPALDAVVRWAAAGCAVRNLASTIQESAMRISSLVYAVKGFTHMDQANVAGPLELGPGLANTVAVLQSKAREKSVTVTLELEAELPKVRGYAGELNQVWGNLIDNALDAVANGGRVEVFAVRENQNVWCGSAMTGRGFRRRFVIASSIHSLQRNRRDREPVLGWILRGAWCAITMALSTSNRSVDGRSFESGCRSRRVSQPTLCNRIS